MAKIDLKKELKELYSPSAKEVTVVDVPPMNFLLIEGRGDPNTSPGFKAAIEALYSVSYALKFMVKEEAPERDYVVMPLEGLWWFEGKEGFDLEDKGSWCWTAMIMQPEFITAEMVARALEEVAGKKDLPALSALRFERFHEGLAAQILHIGPYSAEGQTIERLHRFIAEHGYGMRGKHHEIYLSDPRRVAPEKLKTVIRQPIAKRA
jgi:hypothetical protein